MIKDKTMAIKRLLGIFGLIMLMSLFVGCDDGYEVDSELFQNTFVTSSKQTSTSSSEVNSLENTETSSKTVYITPSGKRWHLNENCAGKNATATTLEKAEEKSLTPCKKCAS